MFCYNYLLKLNHENLLYALVSDTAAFTDCSSLRRRMAEQKQNGLSEKLLLRACGLEVCRSVLQKF